MFDAHGTAQVTVTVAGETYPLSLTDEKQTIKRTFTATGASVLSFAFGEGTAYIDNVRIQEDGLLINGDFSSGMVGYEVYVADGASASGVIKDGSFCMDIDKVGVNAWDVQLKQNDVALEQGKWYEFSFKAKSDTDRPITWAFQRDGVEHKTPEGKEDWTAYHKEEVQIKPELREYKYEFRMDEKSDSGTILCFEMGNIAGTTAEKHAVTLDDLVLREISKSEESVKPVPEGENLLKNGNFAETDGQKAASWEAYIGGDESGAKGTTVFKDNTVIFDLTDVGTDEWHAYLKQFGVTLEKGCTYRLTFEAVSTADRIIKAGFLSAKNDYYDGIDVSLKANEKQLVEKVFTMQSENDTNTVFQMSLGHMKDYSSKPPVLIDTAASTITLSNFVLVKMGGESSKPEDSTPAESNLLTNGDFSKGGESWYLLDGQEGSEAVDNYDNGKVVVTISNIGVKDWHVQLQNTIPFKLEEGAKYKLTYKAKAEDDWAINTAFIVPPDGWYGGEVTSLKAGVEQTVEIEFTVEKETNDQIHLNLSMGKITENVNGQTGGNVNASDSAVGTVITLSDFVLVKEGEGE